MYYLGDYQRPNSEAGRTPYTDMTLPLPGRRRRDAAGRERQEDSSHNEPIRDGDLPTGKRAFRALDIALIVNKLGELHGSVLHSLMDLLREYFQVEDVILRVLTVL